MSRLTSDDRHRLLQDLAQMGSAGKAEEESSESFKRTFYPVVEHVRAFDPDVVLVVGERGTGKSELFRAVVHENLLSTIVRRIPGSRLTTLDLNKTLWLAGHPLGSNFADAKGLQQFIVSKNHDANAVADLWFAYLIRILADKIDNEAQQRLNALIAPQGGDLAGIFQAFSQAGNSPLLALDRLDEQLKQSDDWLFVSYDELDSLADYDWKAMAAGIRGLIGFWAEYARRWKRIRAKIFLRTDLFRRHAHMLGANLIKLAANRVELSWSDRNLMAMLVKRIANASEHLQNYCNDARLKFEPDQTLGLIPLIDKAEDAKPLVDRMVGPYMGKNPKKGRTFLWLLDHIRDGNKKAMPRALVRLVEEAAIQEQRSAGAGYNRLLHPTSLRRALDEVSKEHLFQVYTHELPWLWGVAQRIKNNEVFISRRKLEQLLGQDWEGSWGEEKKISPPVENERELVDYLIEIGVLRLRSDGRIDAPDLFLAGLGLKRHGGVKKK